MTEIMSKVSRDTLNGDTYQTPTAVKVFCASCNQEVEASWNYCASCGAYIYLYKENE